MSARLSPGACTVADLVDQKLDERENAVCRYNKVQFVWKILAKIKLPLDANQ